MKSQQSLLDIGIGNISAKRVLALQGISLDEVLYGTFKSCQLSISNLLFLLKEHHLNLFKQGGNFLDLFCGKGYLMKGFKQHAAQWEVWGVDGNADVIADASTEYPHGNFTKSLCPSLPYPDNYFKIIYGKKIMDYADTHRGIYNVYPQTFNAQELFSEVHRALAPAGLYIANDFLVEKDEKILISTGLSDKSYNHQRVFVKQE